jgi:hypothetical protein
VVSEHRLGSLDKPGDKKWCITHERTREACMYVDDALEGVHFWFLKFLTEDSPHRDRRRRDFNQAIFNAEGGWAIWSSTDLDMVMEKFDKAVREVRRGE